MDDVLVRGGEAGVDVVEVGVAEFADSAVARRFRAWTQVYGMKFSVHSSGGLSLPAGTENPPRYATGGRP